MYFIYLLLAFDRLVCVVDREPITREEIRLISKFYPGVSYYDLVDRVINNKIIEYLAEAETLKVNEEELSQMKDELVANNPNLASLLTDDYLDKIFTEQLKIQIYSNKLLGSKFKGRLKVSPTEAENFYRQHRDSLMMPETITLERLQIPVLPAENNRLLKRAEEILNEYKKGVDFAFLVKKYSDDKATVPSGGKLGKLSPDDIPPNLVGVLELEEGEAGIFESPSGYHIILLEKREGNNLYLSQILLQFKFTKEELHSGEKRALKIKEQWVKGDSTVLDKIETIGPLPIQAISSELISLIDTLKVDKISKPILEGMSFHLLKIKERQESKIPEFSEIKDRLNGLLMQQKMLKLVDELLEKEKKHIFIKKI
jgi:parvulin-like peptidyl-prolyl isomerase